MHHLIPHRLTMSTSLRNEVIPPNFSNRVIMMYHLIQNGFFKSNILERFDSLNQTPC
jgi:hypothetical protein